MVRTGKCWLGSSNFKIRCLKLQWVESLYSGLALIWKKWSVSIFTLKLLVCCCEFWITDKAHILTTFSFARGYLKVIIDPPGPRPNRWTLLSHVPTYYERPENTKNTLQCQKNMGVEWVNKFARLANIINIWRMLPFMLQALSFLGIWTWGPIFMLTSVRIRFMPIKKAANLPQWTCGKKLEMWKL